MRLCARFEEGDLQHFFLVLIFPYLKKKFRVSAQVFLFFFHEQTDR